MRQRTDYPILRTIGVVGTDSLIAGVGHVPHGRGGTGLISCCKVISAWQGMSGTLRCGKISM
jgi:hypothetical protein